MSDVIILLVEDNPDDAALTLRALEKNDITNDMVKVANNGVEALEYLFGTGAEIERGTEIHELALYSNKEMLGFFEESGFEVKYDPVGLFDRGLYLGRSS